MHNPLVAVIDSGWRGPRPDGRVLAGAGFEARERAPEFDVTADDRDRIGHGTACAGLILAAAPAARILPLRVFESRLETSVQQLCAAIDCAIDRKVNLINLSLSTEREEHVNALYAACWRARSAGIVIVAATGLKPVRHYPAMFLDVIGVRGVPMVCWSDFWFCAGQAVECAAHGGPADRPASWRQCRSGSMATARITGLLAAASTVLGPFGLDDARGWLAANATRTDPSLAM